MSELGLLVLGAVGGFVGSILGLGGGVVVVPGLSLLFGLPLREAVAASLVGVVATSAGAAAVYLDRGRVQVPLAIRLEVMAVAGAVAGGLSAGLVPEAWLSLAFALAVLWTAAAMFRGERALAEPAAAPSDVRRPRLAVGGFAGAGAASALLGLGGGFMKVPILHGAMGVPLPVSTATSAFMIGMTAAAGGLIYWLRGDLLLGVAAPVALGVLAGSALGSRVSGALPDRVVRISLALVLLYIAARMGWAGWSGLAG